MPRFRQVIFLARKLLGLSRPEMVALFTAQRELLDARRRLRNAPVGSLVRPVDGGEVGSGTVDEAILEGFAVAVARVSQYGVFRPTCLVRAMALERMIDKVESQSGAVVRVGIAEERGEFLAHAWIELNGKVVGDHPSNIRRFTPLQDFSGLSV